jgi:multidrug efflux pump subunit AcrB
VCVCVCVCVRVLVWFCDVIVCVSWCVVCCVCMLVCWCGGVVCQCVCLGGLCVGVGVLVQHGAYRAGADLILVCLCCKT